jgi:hypothetical protein
MTSTQTSEIIEEKFVPKPPPSLTIKINYYPASYWEPIENEEEKRNVISEWELSRAWIERAVLRHMGELLAEEDDHIHSIEIGNLEGVSKRLNCPLLLTFKDHFKHTKFPKGEDE